MDHGLRKDKDKEIPKLKHLVFAEVQRSWKDAEQELIAIKNHLKKLAKMKEEARLIGHGDTLKELDELIRTYKAMERAAKDQVTRYIQLIRQIKQWYDPK